MYVKGETATKWLGQSNKLFKTFMGVPIGLIYGLITHSWLLALLPMVSYAIMTQFGYGDNNWLTKLVGKKWAITIVGACLGLASLPIIGVYCLIQALISGVAFHIISEFDDADKVKEPYIAILRGLFGTICLPY